MDWQDLKQPEIQNFIRDHENDDVAALALKKPPEPNWSYPLILDQIKARQKAMTKLPSWHATKGIIFPSSATLEQASSEATARYKASLLSGDSFADLTTGSGIDSYYTSHNFSSGICIDSDQDTIARASHNFSALDQNNLNALHQSAEGFVPTMKTVDWIILDPQRRNAQKRGIFRLEDCSPNIIELIPVLKAKAGKILIKTSPMLDLSTSMKQLPCEAVHIVEHKGECKEVLLILNAQTPYPADEVPIFAANIDEMGRALQSLSFTQKEEKSAAAEYSLPLTYIYEPGPAFQKSGAFQTIAARLNLYKLHAHTHLYTADTFHPDFPGKAFKLEGIYPVKKGALPITKANLTIRNFPGEVADLRKKLKLKDGGNTHVFACTLMNNDKVLLMMHKA